MFCYRGRERIKTKKESQKLDQTLFPLISQSSSQAVRTAPAGIIKLKVMENDQNPVPVDTNPRTMEKDQSQPGPEQGPSSLESERYGNEGPSTFFYGLSPLEYVRPEHEGSPSFFEGLSDLESKRHYKTASFFEDLSTFEADEPFQIQSDTAHQQVNNIIPERREEKKETNKSMIWTQLYEESQQRMLDEEVVNQISRHVINLAGGE